ncbi:hypothetical protein ACIQAC_31315 [Streptomyces sp. NPDC088387]|uniref:hypothetical protein n=1 Tax=Streptomyces sp. NPDC088387 TaxID=3365859 RepID=UPI0037F4C011
MEQHEQSSSSTRAAEIPRRPRSLRRPPAVVAFLLLLAVVFTVSYAVGSAAGPVAPGMHRSGTGTDPGDTGTQDGDPEDGTHMDHGSGD